MKYLLLAVCAGLLAGAPAMGQALPVDSATQRVTYRGVVQVPGASADALFARAQRMGLTSVTAAVVDAQHKAVTGVWERPLAAGRSLRYVGDITVSEGQYTYRLSDFENQTGSVRYVAAPGVQSAAAGGTAPLERVLANPSGYRKGKPTAALLAYQAAVSKAAAQAVADLKQRMIPAGR